MAVGVKWITVRIVLVEMLLKAAAKRLIKLNVRKTVISHYKRSHAPPPLRANLQLVKLYRDFRLPVRRCLPEYSEQTPNFKRLVHPLTSKC